MHLQLSAVTGLIAVQMTYSHVQLIGLSNNRLLFIYMRNCEIISDQSTLVRTHIINTYIKAISVAMEQLATCS